MCARPNSEKTGPRRVIVVGGGVSGLMTSLELARASVPVTLLSSSEPRRSPSVLDPDGLNAARDEASLAVHLEDSLRAAAGLAELAPLSAMVAQAPRLHEELCRLGVPFDSGRVQLPASSAALTATAGSRTGQQVLFALDEALRATGNRGAREPSGAELLEPLVERCIGWEFRGLIQADDGRIVGVVARDRLSGVLKPFRGEAVCLATGGWAGLYAGSCSGRYATGDAVASAFRAGALLVDPELVQFRPLAVPGPDKSFGLGEPLRSGGARLFRASSDATNGNESERDYFLEEDAANPLAALAPSELARRIAAGATATFLDLARFPDAAGRGRPGHPLEAVAKLGRAGGSRSPLRVYPAADRTLGGLWVDHEVNAEGKLVLDSPRNHSTSLSGLFAVGECAAQYEGAECLPGNALLSATFGGRAAARSIVAYVEGLARSAWDLPRSLFEKEEARERARLRAIAERKADADLNPFVLRAELGELLSRLAGVNRSKAGLAELDVALGQLAEQSKRSAPGDASLHHNRSLSLGATLEDLVLLSRAVASAALGRAESRGVHHRSDAQPGEPRHSFVRYERGELSLVADAGGAEAARPSAPGELEKGAR